MSDTNGSGNGHERIVLDQAVTADRFEIPVPAGGGLVLLRGANEIGKDRAQAAINELLHPAGGGLAQFRDEAGQARVGTVSGFGVTMRVGARTTRTGKPLAISLEGLDVSVAIDPQLVDEESADRQRAIVFCDLLGLTPDAGVFAPLVGGMDVLRQIAAPQSLAEKSVPGMAERLKRDFDRAAKAKEDEAEHLEGTASGLRQAIGDVDLDAPADEQVLAKATEACVREVATLEGRIAEAKRTQETLGSAAAALERLKGQPQRSEAELQAELEQTRGLETQAAEALGKAHEAALAALATKAAALKVAEDRVQEAIRQRAEVQEQQDALVASAKAGATSAQQAVSQAQQATAGAQQRVQAARKHAEDVAKAERDLQAAGGSIAPAPSSDELAAAQAKLEAARKVQDNGAVVRRSREQYLQAEAVAEAAAKARTIAQGLRDAAGNVWRVVTEAVAPILPEGLRFDGGRLKMRQGANEFFFSELSMGARTDIVVSAAAEALARKAEEFGKKHGMRPPLRVLVVSQHFAESLDREHQVRLDQLAKSKGVLVYGAICDEGELRAVPFEAEPQSLEQSAARGLSPEERQALAEHYAAKRGASS